MHYEVISTDRLGENEKNNVLKMMEDFIDDYVNNISTLNELTDNLNNIYTDIIKESSIKQEHQTSSSSARAKLPRPTPSQPIVRPLYMTEKDTDLALKRQTDTVGFNNRIQQLINQFTTYTNKNELTDFMKMYHPEFITKTSGKVYSDAMNIKKKFRHVHLINELYNVADEFERHKDNLGEFI